MNDSEHIHVAMTDTPGKDGRILVIAGGPSPEMHRLHQSINRRVWAAGYAGTSEDPVPFAIYVTQMALARAEFHAELDLAVRHG